MGKQWENPVRTKQSIHSWMCQVKFCLLFVYFILFTRCYQKSLFQTCSTHWTCTWDLWNILFLKHSSVKPKPWWRRLANPEVLGKDFKNNCLKEEMPQRIGYKHIPVKTTSSMPPQLNCWFMNIQNSQNKPDEDWRINVNLWLLVIEAGDICALNMTAAFEIICVLLSFSPFKRQLNFTSNASWITDEEFLFRPLS